MNRTLKLLPNTSGDQQQGTSGGTRSGTGDCKFETIMPSNNAVTTLESHPTIWLYVQPNEPQENLFVEAQLHIYRSSTENTSQENTVEPAILSTGEVLFRPFDFDFEHPIVTVREKLLGHNLVSLKLPKHAVGLSLEEEYEWNISLTCATTENKLQGHHTDFEQIASEVGTIYRTQPSDSSDALEQNQLLLYLQEGVWIDTINALAHYHSASDLSLPTSEYTDELLKEWTILLRDIENQL